MFTLSITLTPFSDTNAKKAMKDNKKEEEEAKDS